MKGFTLVFIVFLFVCVVNCSSPGHNGICGPSGDGSPMPLECECLNVLGGTHTGFIGGEDYPRTWKAFSDRLNKCVEWCVKEKCALTMEGAYNTCGPCIWHHAPYRPDGYSQLEISEAEKIDVRQNLPVGSNLINVLDGKCCEGVDIKLYPQLFKTCMCPWK